MKNKKGFTLVELLVVIAIIGILSTIAFISLNRARAKARDAKRVSDVRELMSALEIYYNDQVPPSYPNQGAAGMAVLTTTLLPATYIASIPAAPTPADDPTGCSGITCCSNGTNNSYKYHGMVSQTGSECTTAGCAGWYEMSFCMGGATSNLSAGCVRATPSGMINQACP
jgi:general secretion pathway protein G